MSAGSVKWVRKSKSTRGLPGCVWELWDGEALEGFCEPSFSRGCWWWTTWGRRGEDIGGHCWSLASAKACVEKERNVLPC